MTIISCTMSGIAAVALLSVFAASPRPAHGAEDTTNGSAAKEQAKPQPGARPGSFPPIDTILIEENDFRPKVAKFRGGYVEWVNRSSTAHTATSDDGKTFDTGEIAPGDAAYSPWFTTPGEFPYHCKLHGETGTLVVEF